MTVLPSPAMAAPKNPRGGRKSRVPGEDTRPYPVNATDRERARWDAVAALQAAELGRRRTAADVLRDLANAEADRLGVPFDPRENS